MVRVLHRKRVCHVSRRLQIRPSGQRSPPPLKAPLQRRWDQLPPANRHQLLHLLSRLVERQVGQQAPLLVGSGEEAKHDLPH